MDRDHSSSLTPAAVSSSASGTQPRAEDEELPVLARVTGRYVVQESLGRGGTSHVYRVLDANTGRSVALKRLHARDDGRKGYAALFEREFHTLAQLKHPSVIEVYDYGLDQGVPYYTMELLEGGDLRERSPLPWRAACELLYDVCSSLALLHSRKLVHRDIGPRNIRCTHGGRAKLIDFGAMVPMGPCAQVVGTPPFVPPEALYRATLDGRTDLFALGATLYYALTRRMAYPARELSQLASAWTNKPPPPSTYARDVPPALDALVMELISLEPAVRPASAFEVMQKLAAIAGLSCEERSEVQAAYLTTPTLVGRASELATIRAALRSALDGRGGAFVLDGPPGVGHSRMLDACALEAKTLGLTVLRAAAGDEPLATARQLALQALDELDGAGLVELRADPAIDALLEPPRRRGGRASLRDLAALETNTSAGAVQAALARLLGRASQSRPLAVLVDDVHMSDAPSVAVLASLASQAAHGRMLIAATCDPEASARGHAALEVLRSYAAALPLAPLRGDDTHALLVSIFGDVPNLALWSEHVHAASKGLPRACMELTEHFVDQGIARYSGGTWSLPEQLDLETLPANATELMRRRIAELSPLARELARSQALSVQCALQREHYARLAPAEPAGAIDGALDELLAAGVLVSDGTAYRFASRIVPSLIEEGLTAAQRTERHAALASIFAELGGSPILIVHHLLHGGLEDVGIERFLRYLDSVGESRELSVLSDPLLSVTAVAELHARALDVAIALGKGPRVIGELRWWLVATSVPTANAYYWKAAPAWRAQLERDSGLDLYRELGDEGDPGARLGKAFQGALERYQATPEAERGYRPDEAIRKLVQYVACSIPIGSRSLDRRLLKSLPGLLEPFIALSPMIDAVWQNALATVEASVDGKYLTARSRWLGVYERLESVTGDELKYVSLIRNAVAFGIAALEASMGIASAERWASTLDADPMQRVSAMSLRRVMALQRGDAEEAERYRKQAELLAAQSTVRPMFTSFVSVELSAFARARDLTGVQQMRARIELLAAQAPSWLAYKHLADGYFHQLCGEHEAALAAFERCLERATPDERDDTRTTMCWAPGSAAYIDALINLDRAADAKAFGQRTLERWHALGFGFGSLEIERMLALAQARLGEHEAAARRLEDVAARQLEIGVSGLHLGATYEARTRVAIWADDGAAVQEFGAKTAREYRHGHGSPLGARYERLMDEARGAGHELLPELSDLEGTLITRRCDSAKNTTALVAEKLARAASAAERAARALQLVCSLRKAPRGHLYLHDGSALRLAASYGEAAPSSALHEEVEAFFTHALADHEAATAVLTDEASSAVTRPAARGGALEPLELSFEEGEHVVHVGVLALELPRGTVTRSAAHLIEAVAEQLVVRGDASGVRTLRAARP